ncbi:MAG: IS5 family transposase [Candidatus Margulisbacteria bacterium]|nr:IS5 family transposase [Candidatus Margulisiibacteriota bacterium]
MFKELKGFGGNLFEAVFAKNVRQNYASHILVKLTDFDWSFIRDELKGYYSKEGQNAFDPVLMFKIVFLKEAMNLNSDYQLEELANLHILFRFFLNVSFDDKLPDRSTIIVFRNLLIEKALFDKAFHKVVLYAREKGFLGACLGAADSTVVEAKVNLSRWAKKKEDDKDEDYIDRNSPDKDAAFGAKGKEKFYGYKSHQITDVGSGLVVAALTTSANVHDVKPFPDLLALGKALLQDDFLAITADKAYNGREKEIQALNLIDFVIPKDNQKFWKNWKESNDDYVYARSMRCMVERPFAVGKRSYRLKRSRYWGLLKTHAQALLTYTAYNLKKIFAVPIPLPAGAAA